MEKWILLGTILIRKILFCGSVKANGVILADIVNQLDTTNSLVAWAFSLQNGIALLISPLVMFLLNYFSERQLCMVGGLLGGLGYIYCGLMMTSVYQLFIGLSVSGFGFGLAILPSFVSLQYHFQPTELPLIISAIGTFDYIGVAILPPVLQLFRSDYGLKNSLILLGALAFNVATCGAAARRPRNVKQTNNKQTNAVRQPDQEEPASNRDTKGIRKLFSNLRSLFQHKNIGILLIAEFVAFYVFASWAIFLVSLGKTQGLTDEESVFLSTAGGLGGFIGKCSAAVLFKFKLVNPFTATLIPCFTTAAVFVVATMSTDFHILLALIFISGLTQGINSSCVFSLMPGSVCPYHYRQILILECLSCGLGTQFSGYVSGTIQDVTGSTIYVYLFNAMLNILLVLLSIWWACDPEPNLECDKSSL
ncbi:monocarboxylate transporter 2-like [Apostichopus japonicus]|uniref:monocarboxylate transporter 2-like n=1 Tax=Stichopus japonicus TaxID=307972 RepID=UPI003AB2332F